MKKVFVTRKLLEPNEKRISKIWNAKLNSEAKSYSKRIPKHKRRYRGQGR